VATGIDVNGFFSDQAKEISQEKKDSIGSFFII
jgi:hypothetical protein